MAVKSKKITMRDVGLAADVSAATVSYVLNGRSDELSIEPATRKRVLAVANKLGYRVPQTVGRGGRQIGVLFPNLTGEFMGQQISGIQEALRDYQYQSLVCICGDDPKVERSDMKMFLRRNVGGVIVFPCFDKEVTERWQKFVADSPPVVFTGRQPPGLKGVDCVSVDNPTIGEEAADVLVREGCRSFIVVTDNVSPRLSGFKDRLKFLGRPAPREILWKNYQEVMNTLHNPPPHTGLFAVRDGILFPTLYLAMRQNQPVDPSVVIAGVGNIAQAYPLTNRCWMAEHPAHEMGRLAATRLLYRIGESVQSPSSLSLHMRWETNLMLAQHLKDSIFHSDRVH